MNNIILPRGISSCGWTRCLRSRWLTCAIVRGHAPSKSLGRYPLWPLWASRTKASRGRGS
eukprot:6456644-Amphidinium_carterae.1